MGWDSFGLPAENAAIRNNEHPATYTYANIETPVRVVQASTASASTGRAGCNTSDPEYYRWTQWLFLKFRERGLAYRKNSPVNWCPNDQTVLANEQVVDGHCERCGAEVTKRELTQWYFKITDYAQRLLDDLDAAGGHLARAGRQRPAQLDRPLRGRARRLRGRRRPSRSRSTRRARTRCSARRSWWSPPTRTLAGELVTDEQRPAFEAYLEEVRKASDIERLSTDRPKTGVFLGVTRDQPGQRRSRSRCGPPTTCWPTTAPARSWRCPGRTSATGTSPRSSTCRSSAPSSRRRAWEGEAYTGAGAGRSTPPTTRSPWTGWTIAEAKTRDHRLAGGARAPARARSTSGCATGC